MNYSTKNHLRVFTSFSGYDSLFFETPDKEIEDRAKTMLISYIFNAFCKGWNDCFDRNVKHIK